MAQPHVAPVDFRRHEEDLLGLLREDDLRCRENVLGGGGAERQGPAVRAKRYDWRQGGHRERERIARADRVFRRGYGVRDLGRVVGDIKFKWSRRTRGDRYASYELLVVAAELLRRHLLVDAAHVCGPRAVGCGVDGDARIAVGVEFRCGGINCEVVQVVALREDCGERLSVIGVAVSLRTVFNVKGEVIGDVVAGEAQGA